MRAARRRGVGLVAALAACTSGAPIPGDGAGEPVVTRIDSSAVVLESGRGLGDPTRTVIRDSAAWREFWAQAHSLAEPIPAPPPVDFADSMLLVAALGTRATGGYAVSIDSVARGAALRVFVTALTPAPDCVTTMAITWPVQVVRVARFDGSVEFIEATRVRRCR